MYLKDLDTEHVLLVVRVLCPCPNIRIWQEASMWVLAARHFVRLWAMFKDVRVSFPALVAVEACVYTYMCMQNTPQVYHAAWVLYLYIDIHCNYTLHYYCQTTAYFAVLADNILKLFTTSTLGNLGWTKCNRYSTNYWSTASVFMRMKRN